MELVFPRKSNKYEHKNICALLLKVSKFLLGMLLTIKRVISPSDDKEDCTKFHNYW